MKFTFKRVLSFAIALVMILGLLPTIQQHAHAASTLTVPDANIGLSWTTTASGSKGKASWTAIGNNLTGTTTGYVSVIFPKTVTATLTITNNHSEDRTLVFDYTLTGGGSVSGTISGTSGSYSDTLAAGASTTITLTSPTGSGNTNTLTITGLQLLSSGNVTSTFLAPENGSYTVDGTAVTAETTKEKAATEAYTLNATPASGYKFFGWWSNASNSYVSYDNPASVKFGSDPQLKPVFIGADTALFGVGAAKFADLTEAANYALTATTKTVVLLNNGTLRGEHTIPAGVTLLIPFDDSNTLYTNEPACTSSFLNNVAWVKPTAYRTLVMAADAKITVNGAMSLSAQHAAANGSSNYCGSPTGPVSFVTMQEGANITVNNGGKLYAWGFITGSGSVTANSGATVYENFQITDFRGGSATTAYANAGLAFPLNQYYVQNIEVPVTFYSGASEIIYTSAYSSSMCLSGEATFIGNGGMFTSSEGGYVVKDYDEATDRLNVDLYGSCELNSMKVNLSIEVDSAKFLLPITNNVSIGIHSGTTTLKQSVALLPGVEVTVDQGATLNLAYSGTGINDFCTDGYNLIVYDRDEWFYGLSLDEATMGEEVTGVKYGLVLHSNAPVPNGYAAKPSYFAPVLYAPGRTGGRTDADLKDAVLNINGTLVADGFIYTTIGGASIISSEKTGTIVMQSGAGADMITCQNNGTTSVTLGLMIRSAWLQNGDGSYLQTMVFDEETGDVVSAAEPGTAYNYCATHDCWYTGECEKCNATVEITWMINGVPTTQDGVAVGTTPSYPNGTPAKAADASGHYTFAGWATTEDGEVITLPAVTDNATYYAVFTSADHNDDKIEGGKHYCSACDYLIGSCNDTNKDHKCDVGGEDMACHQGTLTKQDGQSATCGADGWNAYYRCSCGKYYVDNQAQTLIPDLEAWKTGDGKISATGNHTPETDDGDCTTAIECSVCGTVTTPAKDAHTPEADDGDCTTAVKCVNCDKNAVEAKSHDYKITGYDEYYSYHTAHYACENDGCNATKVESDVLHDYTYDPVNHKCVCGKTETFTTVIDFNGYVYEDDTKYATTNSYGSDIMYFLEAWGKNMSKREGYNFLGWTTVKDDASTLIGTESYIVTEARTLYALWETTSYTITLMVDDKQYGDVLTFAYGAEITGLPTPEKAANGCTIYTFSGWQEEVPETMPAENLILHATFTTEISHTAGEPVIENEVAATCGADGSYDTVVYCSVCDEELSRKTIPVPATGEHGWKLTEYVWDWVEKPEDVTCTANAACQTCGATTSADAVMTVEKTDDAWCYMPASYKWTAEFDVEWAETQTHAGPYGSEMDPNRHGTTTNLVKIDEDTHQAFCYYCQTYLGEPAPHDQKTVNFAGNCVAAANYTCSCGYNYYGEVNPDVHAAGSILAYTDITDDQHTAYHPCCNAKEEPAPHDYATGTSEHTCACGTVEKFTITWTVDGETVYTASYTYGAPLNAEELDAAAEKPAEKDHYTFAYDYSNLPETITGDIIITGAYTPVKYTLRFIPDGAVGEEFTMEFTVEDEWKPLPECPFTKEGHTFYIWQNVTKGYGWYTQIVNPEFADLAKANNNEVVMKPYFEANTYTITLEVDGVQYGEIMNVKYGETITLPTPTKAQSGCTTYTFSGWNETVPETMPAENLTFTGSFTESTNHTDKIEYTDNDDGTHTVKCACGETINAAESHDYTTGTSAYTCICGDVKQFKVFWYDWNSNDLGTSLVDYGAPLPAGPAIPEIPEGYYGTGWCDEWSGDNAPETMPANDLYLKYFISPIKYTVAFLYENGETWEVHDSYHGDVIKNLAENYPYPDTKVGHTFIGWGVKDATGKIELVTEMTVTGELTLYPVFEVNKYTLTVYDMPAAAYNADPKEFTVTYGTNILEFINGKVDLNNVDVNNDLYKGYYFWQGHWMDYTNWITIDEDSIVSDNIEIFAASLYHGWQRMSTDDPWSYSDMGAFVTGWHEVDGEWYYFFMNEATYWNYPATGLTRVPYPTEEINGIKYLPDAETLEYCANKGTTFIDETYAWFGFDADGKFQSDFTGLTAHPVIENVLCYAENGMLVWHPGFVEVDGELYYFIGDVDNGGNIPANGDTYITRPNGVDGFAKNDVYNFADGKLSGVNGIVNMKYYENSKLMMGKGLVALEVDGEIKYIYVRTSGQLATGKYWISNNNGLPVKLKGYDFDENGYMMVPVDPSVNGFVMVDGTKYYYKDGEPYGAGLIEVEGNFYYVRWTGEVVVNCEYWVTTTNGHMDQGKYAFDENGVMQLNTGVINGYYYVDGQIAYGAGLIEWNGDIYYVRSNGQVATGEYWPTTLNGILPAGKYTFDEDGKLITD